MVLHIVVAFTCTTCYRLHYPYYYFEWSIIFLVLPCILYVIIALVHLAALYVVDLVVLTNLCTHLPH